LTAGHDAGVPPREHGDQTRPERRERFARVFADVYEPLQRYARRRIGESAVDDVVADTLLVLWRRLDDVPAASELAWCYGAARRCLANHRRGDERYGRLVDRVAREPAASVDPFEDPDPGLTAALAELSADDREIVRLWAWERLVPREMAVALGITPNAASIRLHRAKHRLARRLAAGKEGGPTGHKLGGDQPERREEGA
jgi:RNA polymerase sigma-70 factor (ECF subfamily)